MSNEDEQLLECIEDVYHALDKALLKMKKIRSVHVTKLETLAEDLRSQRRIFEDVSLPARLIIEHLISLQYQAGQVALETEYLRLSSSNVCAVKAEEFGLIKVLLGELEITWHDSDYFYFFYPDKVELRAKNERSSIKLFFSIDFSLNILEKFAELSKSPNVKYIHPQIEQQ